MRATNSARCPRLVQGWKPTPSRGPLSLSHRKRRNTMEKGKMRRSRAKVVTASAVQTGGLGRSRCRVSQDLRLLNFGVFTALMSRSRAAAFFL